VEDVTGYSLTHMKMARVGEMLKARFVLIALVLEQEYTQTEAARELGLPRTTIQHNFEVFGLRLGNDRDKELTDIYRDCGERIVAIEEGRVSR